MLNRILIIIASIWVLLLFSCASQKVKPIPRAEDQFEIAKQEYESRDWSNAVLEFQKLIFNYPGFAKADSAQFLLGMSYFNDKEYPLAAGEFNKMVYSFPTSPLTDDAMFYAGVCALNQSPGVPQDQEYTHLAIDRLETFLEEYPRSELVPLARQKLLEARSKLAEKTYKTGKLYEKMKNYDSALIYLNEVLELYADTPWAPEALFLTGEVYLKQEKLDRAKETFAEFVDKYPESELTEKAKEKINHIQEE